MSNLKRVQKLLKKTSRIPLASLNYHLGNYKEPIWLVGDGRSGSTWVSDLINWDRRYREIFEPFHPYIVKRVQDFSLFQYLKPDDTESYLADFLRSVFSGEFKHLRADVSQPRLFYDGLLVKDIFANLLIPWVNQNLPHVRKILLIRNPFAVALSKQRLKDWTWLTEPQLLLEQQPLYEDYLAPFEEVIRTVGDDLIERHILIWAIIHYIPLMNLDSDDIYILFYEDLVSHPKEELERLFNFLGRDTSEGENLFNRIYKPTRTSHGFTKALSRESLLDSWKDSLSTQTIDRGMRILEKFQLEAIYEDRLKPNKAALSQGNFSYLR